jgi:hypothetical protein
MMADHIVEQKKNALRQYYISSPLRHSFGFWFTVEWFDRVTSVIINRKFPFFYLSYSTKYICEKKQTLENNNKKRDLWSEKGLV